jgi:hypothetical protein
VSDILLQLKKLKNDSRAGAVSREEHAAAKARVLGFISAEGGGVSMTAPSYASWMMGSFISKPVTVSVAAVVLAVGSLSTVNAAADSLPGDTLYSVKRITEQAQLKLASLDRRAVLHTEFAERRLNEAAELQKTVDTHPQFLTLAKTAMAEYKQELTQASSDLKELQTSGSTVQTTLATVTNVQDKIGTMEAVLDGNVALSQTQEEGQDAIAARQVAKDTQQVATTVAVDAHEAAGTELSTREMKEMFRKNLGSMEARQTFDEHRLDVIAASIAARADVLKGVEGIPTLDDLKHMRYVITQSKLQIPEAMNGFVAGGYRSAFVTLQGIDVELLNLESGLAQIEITIMTTVQAADAAAAEEQEVNGVNTSGTIDATSVDEDSVTGE